MLQYETVSIVYNRMVKLNVHWIDNPHVPIHSTVYRAVVYLLNKDYWNDQLCTSVFVPCIYSSQVVVLNINIDLDITFTQVCIKFNLI
jgi:hypothetical protein